MNRSTRCTLGAAVCALFGLSTASAMAQEAALAQLPPAQGAPGVASAPAPATPGPAAGASATAGPLPSVAAPPTYVASPDEPSSQPNLGHGPWRVDVGVRTASIADGSYDPFSKTSAFTQFSLSGHRDLVVDGRLRFGVGLGWDYGKTSATARSYDSALSVHRLSVPLEGSYEVTSWFMPFVRVAPGALLVDATLGGGGSGNPNLETNSAAFSADASAGIRLRIFRTRGPAAGVGLWLAPEGGYGWSTGAPLNFKVVDSTDADRADGVSLRALALRGAYFRASLSATF